MKYSTEYRARYWAKQAASLTEEQRNWLLSTRRRRRAGERRLTNEEIGAKLGGKTAYWVSGVARFLGAHSRTGQWKPKAPMSEQDNTLFAQMWNDGAPVAEIGERWGYGGKWASMWADKLGLLSRNPVVSNRQVVEIRRRAAEGESIRIIAAAVGVSPTTVRRYAKGFKAPTRKHRGAPSKINAGLADRMFRSGMTQGQIGAHFGVSRQAVGCAIQKYRKHLEARSAQKPKFLIPPVRIAA